MAEEMIEQKRFTCPRCGSHKFGTHTPDWGEVPVDSIGTCHGYVHTKLGQIPCGFTWPRKDDVRYVKGTGQFIPAVGMAQAVPRK